nr:SpoIIE family protein phosphatase [uncultured Actinoplanes sp.]
MTTSNAGAAVRERPPDDVLLLRHQLLLSASERLAAAATTDEVAATVASVLSARMDVVAVALRQCGEQSDALSRRAVIERRTLHYGDRSEVLAAFPELGDDLDYAAVVCAPLITDRAILGTLQLRWDKPRFFYVGERAFLAALTAHVARALERTLRHEAEATTFPELPRADGYQLAARYLPAGDAAKVGGDWYDAVATADGRLMLVIGDVAGHDAAAAARMNDLRCRLRSYAVDRRASPAELLTRLETANHALGDPAVATSIVAVLDRTAAGEVTLSWSNAGNPPPLLIGADRGVCALAGHDMLLGACVDSPRRTRTRLLREGETLLLHTDGLVEDRRQLIDVGYRRLHQRLRGGDSAGLDGLLADAVGGPGDERADDIALLAVRIGG